MVTSNVDSISSHTHCGCSTVATLSKFGIVAIICHGQGTRNQNLCTIVSLAIFHTPTTAGSGNNCYKKHD